MGRGLWFVVCGNEEVAYTPANSGISSFAVHSMFVDSGGGLWIGTYRDGLSVVSPWFDVFRRYTVAGGDLTQNAVTAVHVHDGIIYAGLDGGGLNIIDKRHGKTIVLTAANSSLAGDNILAMKSDGRNLWLRAYGKGVCRYSFEDGSIVEEQEDVEWNKADHLTDDAGNEWKGTNHGLCCRLKASGNELYFSDRYFFATNPVLR